MSTDIKVPPMKYADLDPCGAPDCILRRSSAPIALAGCQCAENLLREGTPGYPLGSLHECLAIIVAMRGHIERLEANNEKLHAVLDEMHVYNARLVTALEGL